MSRKRRPPHPKPPKSPKSPRSKPTSHPPRSPDVRATRRATIGAVFGRGGGLPASELHAVADAARAVNLAAPASGGLADVILDIAGAEHASLHATLAAWQREQDRVLNRTWRRPGGLVRPANL